MNKAGFNLLATPYIRGGVIIQAITEVSPDSQRVSFDVNGTYISSSGAGDGSTQPPEETPTLDSNIPSTPGGMINPYFNYHTLPRVPIQSSDTLVVNVPITRFLVENIDYSDCFLSGDWVTPIHGMAYGQVILGKVQGYDISPRSTNSIFKRGSSIEWIHEWVNGNRLICRSFIITPPSYSKNNKGEITLTLQIGDIFKLKEVDTNLCLRPYCGRPIRDSSTLTQVFARQFGLEVTSPTRYPIPEDLGNFYEESPWEFIAKLHEPLNYDVRTSPDGQILILPRPEFNQDLTHPLNHIQTIETSENNESEPFTQLKVYTEFSEERPIEIKTIEYVTFSDNYDEFDLRPWFVSNSLKTNVTITYLGDTEIYRKEDSYGWRPALNIIPKDDIDDNPCDPNSTKWNSIPTQQTLVNRKISRVYYEPHISGAYLVVAREERESGLLAFENPSGDWELKQGTIRHVKELYTNTPQVDSAVCPKDYIYLRTSYSREVREQLNLTTFSLTESILENYILESGDRNSEQWTKELETYNRNETNSKPRENITDRGSDPPPNSEFITAANVDQRLQTTVSSGLTPSRTAKPINAPFAFSLSALETWGLRWLREQYGLSQSLTLVVPYHSPIELGDSVSYTDFDSNTIKGIVYSVEVNQTASESTKTILLAPVF